MVQEASVLDFKMPASRSLSVLDSDAASVETHIANLGGLGFVGDLHDPEDFLDHLRAWQIRTVDIVAGGVPCQPFSKAGRSGIRHQVRSGLRDAARSRAGDLWRVLEPGNCSHCQAARSNHGECAGHGCWGDREMFILRTMVFELERELGYSVEKRGR